MAAFEPPRLFGGGVLRPRIVHLDALEIWSVATSGYDPGCHAD